jgi:hypothetical protein
MSPLSFGELTMSLITSYKSFVASKLAWSDALAQALGKKKYLEQDVVESLAQAHAEAYGEKYGTTIWYQQSSTGSWYFYSDEDCTRENRHDTATKQWQRNVSPYHNVKKQKGNGKVSKQVDAVQALVEKFNALSKAEQTRFLKAVK